MQKIGKFVKFLPKPRKIRFARGFMLIIKGNDNFNIHMKFQVRVCSNVIGLRENTNIARWQPLSSTPNFDSLAYPNLENDRMGWSHN